MVSLSNVLNTATDALDSAGRALGDNVSSILNGGQTDTSGFSAATPPSISGYGTRKLKPLRPAVSKRKLIRWMVPEQPIVEMYVNPKSLTIDHSKQISSTRTKGGFSLQYWGENLIKISLNGTTGTSGIEGMNVLLDVYRNEQLMFDPYALMLQAQRDRAEDDGILNDLTGIGDSLLGEVSNTLRNAANGGIPSVTRIKPTLASMAFTVEMYWSGEVYRGYFENITITEDSANLGFFEYRISFIATQKRGYRQNFMPWHKSPSYGPSNWKAIPNSFGSLSNEYITPAKNRDDQIGLGQAFADIADNSFRAAGGIVTATAKSGQSIIDAFDVF